MGTSYQIARSIRISDTPGYFSRTSGNGNRLAWTFSCWIKRGLLTAQNCAIFEAGTNSTNDCSAFFTTADTISFYDRSSSVVNGIVSTVAVFRDTAAWAHYVFVYDSANATGANRMQIYVNGVLQAVTGVTTLPQNTNSQMNLGTNPVYISNWSSVAANSSLKGYMADINFVDGLVLMPSAFGQTDPIIGIWTPKAYTGAFGTNGYHLAFADNSAATAAAIGKDTSGNGNNWTPSGISVTAGVTNDSLTDTPTSYGADTGLGGEVRGNYCTWNPLDRAVGSPSLSNGNLNAVLSSNAAFGNVTGSAGKFYFECTVTAKPSTTFLGVDVGSVHGVAANIKLYYDTGSYSSDGGGSSSAYGASYTAGDIIGVAVDCVGNSLTFYKNGVSQGTITSVGVTAGFTAYAYSGGATIDINFGQRAFANTAPTGFKALCTQNMSTPVIVKPNLYFDATLYNGSASPQSIANAGGFLPDLTWVKDRTSAQDHKLTDSVRGVTKGLISDTTGAETTDANGITAFNSNGFTLGAGTRAYSDTNADAYVGWQWKKGALPGMDIVGLTAGASGNNSFSHSLGVAPAFVIIKDRQSGSANWVVYHSAVCTATNLALVLNSTAALATITNVLGASLPNSTTYFYNSGSTVIAGNNVIAYLFAAVPGFSAFGSYTGNGSADGPFVWCGFRPRFILTKCSTAVENWTILDTARDTINIAGNYLEPNSSGAEGTLGDKDFLSNGFKLRSSSYDNTSGQTYVYAVFADVPFKYSVADAGFNFSPINPRRLSYLRR